MSISTLSRAVGLCAGAVRRHGCNAGIGGQSARALQGRKPAQGRQGHRHPVAAGRRTRLRSVGRRDGRRIGRRGDAAGDRATRSAAGVSVTVKRTASYPAVGGGAVWVGGDPAREVDATLVLKNGKLTGTINRKGRMYDIRPIGRTKAHLVREIKISALRSAEMSGPVPAAKRIGGGGSGEEISVLIAYTDTAFLKNPDIEALANAAIANANQTFARSGVGITFKVAGLMWAQNYDEAHYVEQNGGSEDACPSGYVRDEITPFEYKMNLPQLRLGCGYLSHVITARNQLRADLVMLVVNRGNTPEEPICGYGYGPGYDEKFKTGPVQANYGVSVATASCLSSSRCRC